MTVTFGSGVTRVPAYLFATGDNWSNNTYAHVKKITLSSNITSIGAYAFYNCYDLNSTNLRDTTNLKKIEEYAFCNTAIRSVTFPSKLNSINEYAFLDCDELNTITLPKSVTNLGNCAFKNCSRLSNIVINGNIGDCDSGSTWSSSVCSVFYGAGTNTDGMTVTFGSGVTRVPAYLFATGDIRYWSNNTEACQKITLSSNITSIAYAFYNCYDLKQYKSLILLI